MSALGSPLPANGSYFASPLPELSANWRTPARPCRAFRHITLSTQLTDQFTPADGLMTKTLSKQLPPPLRRSPVVATVEEVHGSDENRDSSNQAPSSLFPPRPPANRRQSLVPLFAASNVAPQLRLRTSIASSIEMSPPPKPVARRLSVFCCTPNPATPLACATPASIEVDSVAAQLNNIRLRGGNEPPRHPVIPRYGKKPLRRESANLRRL